MGNASCVAWLILCCFVVWGVRLFRCVRMTGCGCGLVFDLCVIASYFRGCDGGYIRRIICIRMEYPLKYTFYVAFS